MKPELDVIVIGAGPVGLVTALLLGRQGHRVVLLDKWHAPYPLPRAIGIGHESLRILHWAGTSERLKSALLWDERLRQAEFVSSEGEVLSTVEMRTRAESGFLEMQGFNQPDVEALIEEQIATHACIQVLRGKLALDVTQDAGSVQMTVVDAEANGVASPAAQQTTLTAKFVVGCDGAGSLVRPAMDAAVHDLGFAADWLVVDIEPTIDRQWKPYLGQTLGPKRPVTFAPAGPGRRRFEFMLMPGETKEDLAAEGSVWQLLGEYGVTPNNARLARHAIYTFRALWATQWRRGRLLIAGDAAHLTPPFLAQGLNAGLRDAATLSWRLDFVLRGVLSQDTLDDYTRERVDHAAQVVTQAVEVGRIISPLDPQLCEERDGMLRFLRDNPQARPPQPVWRMGPGAVLKDYPHAAVLGRQGQVRLAGKQGRFDDVCGAGRFVLLARRSDPLAALSPAARACWDRLGGVAVQVGRQAPVEDLEGVYEEWFDETGSDVILVRPDFYVFGTGASVKDADGLVLQLATRLGLK